MSAQETRFIEPLDVLFLRGNKLFGDPGSYGEALIPPWPSAAAGALRSRLLADAGVDLAAFARGEIDHPELGTPRRPGSFTVTAFQLARRGADGVAEPLYAPPADLVLGRDSEGKPQARALTPTPLPTGEGLKPSGIQSSAPLPWLPVLAESQRGKPESGYWLTAAGWRDYLAGRVPAAGHWVNANELWAIDPRVGVGLDVDARRAADGKLFSVQAVALFKQGDWLRRQAGEGQPAQADYDVGFLATVRGATLPASGSLRLGGDGRAAALSSVEMDWPEPDYAAIAAAGRCRLVLTTPGLFCPPLPAGEPALSRVEGALWVRAGGWLPTGVTRADAGGYRFDLHGIKGRLACAAVPRAEVVSGWDLAEWQPKPAQRAVPAGSVYWLDELETTAEALRKLVECGLWTEAGAEASRRAEGFNRASLALWTSR